MSSSFFSKLNPDISPLNFGIGIVTIKKTIVEIKIANNNLLFLIIIL